MSDHDTIDLSPPAAPLSRRALLAAAAAAAGTAVVATMPEALRGQQAAVAVAATPTPIVIPADPTKQLGLPTSAIGERSPFVNMVRTPTGVVSGSSLTPIHQITGTIIPADLQFERHHAGVALIDPDKYQLLIHGLVEQPLTFSLADLKSLPSITRPHFLECAGNGRGGYKNAKPDATPQAVDGMLGNSEWTGVPVKLLLNETGVKSGAEWALAEGGDAALLSRSVPVSKLMDDAFLAYAQNGEPLRPAGGYPVRLILPGWEGNMNIKWIRRLELNREPNMSKDETSRYSDPLPNGTARQFSFEMDAKSTILYPTSPVQLNKPGWVQISGLAWSGRGKITAVDVSVDGGTTWFEAELQTVASSKAALRFTHMWNWDGRETRILSRATDETGYTQPSLDVYRATRGPGTEYHYNHTRSWVIKTDGTVVYGDVV